MARRCDATGKGVQYGNSVSHANNKSRRRFEPNVQVVSLWSEGLGKRVRLKVATSGLRTIEHRGGLDIFLKTTPLSKLTPDLKRLKKQLNEQGAAAAEA